MFIQSPNHPHCVSVQKQGANEKKNGSRWVLVQAPECEFATPAMATYTRRENGRGEVTLEKKEKPGRASVGGRRGQSERKVVLKKGADAE